MTGHRLPDAVVALQTRANGDDGRAWVERFPELLRELVSDWQLAEVGEPFAGGCVAFVAPARTVGGAEVVLKLSFVDGETRNEADALRAWSGRRAVRLIDDDPVRGAMLLERIHPGTALADHPDRAHAVEVGCALLRTIWQAPRADHPFARVTDLAAGWGLELPIRWAALDSPFDPALLDHALECCAALTSSDRAEVIVNRDFHLGNVLASDRSGWLVIDPKPLVGEPAFDTGHLIGTLFQPDASVAEASVLVGRVARLLGLNAERVRKWAFVRAFESALWSREVGMGDGSPDVAHATLLADL